jgi:hypothetical protein
MIWVGFVGGVVLVVFLARLFGTASRDADRPTFVVDSVPLPRRLAPVAAALDRWKEEGRLSREEHERLSALMWEDAAKDSPRS